ncbi:hypothetical protein ZWY2020_050053 [Hordeum vulgare]|nr:hypothetical protein ZWY2020_050053 [Hordeum vulgare]
MRRKAGGGMRRGKAGLRGAVGRCRVGGAMGGGCAGSVARYGAGVRARSGQGGAGVKAMDAAGAKGSWDGVKKDKRGKADDIASKLSLETVWAAKHEKNEIKEAARNARYAQQLELRKEEIALKKKEDARNIGRMHEDSLN